MNKEIFVAFTTQKDGADKSTITAFAVNHLHNMKGCNVAAIDYDDLQHSVHGLREYGMVLIGESIYFKAFACNHFRKIERNTYSVIKSNAMNALNDAKRTIAAEVMKSDVASSDMPGTLRSSGVIKTLSQMDYIFTSLSADHFAMESTLRFITMSRDRLMATEQVKIKGLYLFWTMVGDRKRSDLYGTYEEAVAEMDFPAFSTRLPDSKKFHHDLSGERESAFCSTVFLMDAVLLKGSGIREFSGETSDIIRPQ